MPQPNDPSTHDDLIDIQVNLAALSSGVATLTTILLLADDVTPGGGRVATYTSVADAAADETAGNLDATTVAILTDMFAQDQVPDEILVGQVDLAGSTETAEDALDAVIATGAQFYGVLYGSRTVARQIALAVDIEAKADAGTFLLLGLQDDDADWYTTGVPSAWSSVDGFERTVLYFHDDNGADADSDRLEACHFADRLSYDPDETSAGWTSACNNVDALGAGLTATQKQALRDNNANTARPFGTTTSTYVDPGRNMAGRPVDHVVSADWLRTRVAEGIADLMVSTAARGSKIPVNATGQSLIAAKVEETLQLGVEVGHFLDYAITRLPITAADIAAGQVRLQGQVETVTGIRKVNLGFYFDNNPIA